MRGLLRRVFRSKAFSRWKTPLCSRCQGLSHSFTVAWLPCHLLRGLSACGSFREMTYSFPDLEQVCCFMSSSNCCFLTCIQFSQEAGQVVWYSRLLKNFPQFVVIHIVKGFDVVNKAEVDVFLELSCFFQIFGFSVIMFGCESWTIKKSEHQRIDAFELCWRRLLSPRFPSGPGMQGLGQRRQLWPRI